MKLVWDRADCTLTINHITVVAAPRAYPPFVCQAYAEEQDTQLILGEQSTLKDPGKPTWYLGHTLERDEGNPLGSVILKGTTPLRLQAVVHDLDQEPSCTSAAVRAAYQNILLIAREHDLTSLALPLLGSVHGRIDESDSLRYLYNALQQETDSPLQRIWLIVRDRAHCPTLLAHVKSG